LPTPSVIVTRATFALYPHKGLTDHKLVMGHFPWLDGLYLVDIITVVLPCVLAKSLEIQFPLRANKADQTYLHIVAGLGHLSAYPFGLDLGCQHLVHIGLCQYGHQPRLLTPLVLTLVANILSTLAFANMVTSPDCCQGTLDSGVVCIILVFNYLGQDIKISAQVTCCHVLHNHALYCSIKLLHFPIAAGLILEASNMLDMEVLKQLLHAGVGELTTVVALEHLGGMLLEEWSKHFQHLLCLLLGDW